MDWWDVKYWFEERVDSVRHLIDMIRVRSMVRRQDANSLITLLSNPNRNLRRLALHALSDLGNAAAVGPLADVIKDSRADEIDKRLAVESLGKIGNPGCVPILLAASSDRDESVRNSARAAARKICANSIDPLIQALHGSDGTLQQTSADLLGDISDKRATDPLCSLLKAPHMHVREAAAKALGKLRDPQAVAPLLAALSDQGWLRQGRAAVAEALVKIADTSIAPSLFDALSDKTSWFAKRPQR